MLFLAAGKVGAQRRAADPGDLGELGTRFLPAPQRMILA
jgi:hypothetical protein